MSDEVRQLIIVPLELDTLEVKDLRCLRAAQGYAELGMYTEADAEIAKLSRTCRVFRLLHAQSLCRRGREELG
jgi:hypothetical protein